MNWQNHLPLQTDEVVLWEGRPVVWCRALRCAPLTAMGGCLVCLLFKVLRSDPGALHEVGVWLLALLAALLTFAPLAGWFEAKPTAHEDLCH